MYNIILVASVQHNALILVHMHSQGLVNIPHHTVTAFFFLFSSQDLATFKYEIQYC